MTSTHATITPGSSAAHAFVRKVVSKYVRDAHDADDVTQEAMLNAHRFEAQYGGDAKYSSWLYQVATRAALTFLRRQKREPDANAITETSEGVALELPADDDPRAQVIALDEVTRARRAVAQLGEKCAVVFERRYADGMTEGEVAEELGLTVAAVKARAHRARIAAAVALVAA